MKLNSQIKFRCKTEMKNEIKDISERLGFKECDLARYLMNRALMQLKADIVKAGSVEKLQFTIRHD